jgi:putative CocE/NonD family hydrolase
VLVTRTPYGKGGRDVLIDRDAAVARGYAVVVQDIRGRGDSGGSFVPVFAHERDDGYDTVEWAAQQPWSDGNVGIYGASGMGLTGLQALVSAPPHLRAAFVYAAGVDLHEGKIWSRGVLELGFATHWTLFSFRLDETIRRADLPRAEQDALLASLDLAQRQPWDTIRRLPLTVLFDARIAPQWREWLAHPREDEYWKAISVLRRAAHVTAPLLHGTGWYDLYLGGHLDLYRALHASPARNTHRLFIGPWDHMSYLSSNTSAAGERDFGAQAIGGPALLPDLLFAWFDRWLKHDPTRRLPAPVRYFAMGPNAWRDAEAWPPPHSEVRYHLRSSGHANTRHGDGRLEADAATGDEAPDTYVYDPRDPVPTVGGRSLHREWGPMGVFDQSAVEERPDVLVYTSAALRSPLEIAGHVRAVLHLATDAEDSDFSAKLVDVAPSGYAANIAEGLTRARYRGGTARDDWIDARGFTCTVDLCDVAHTFAAGHRVRLEVSSSNFPRFSRNLNTRVVPEHGTEADIRVARHQVWHTSDRASYLELPVVHRIAKR